MFFFQNKKAFGIFKYSLRKMKQKNIFQRKPYIKLKTFLFFSVVSSYPTEAATGGVL